MSKLFETKDTDKAINTTLDVDDTSRRVKVVVSKMGNIDLDNDVIDRGAYTKTIKERGPKGAKMIWFLTDHNASLKSAIAKFSDIFVEGDNLIGVADIPKTSWGNDMLEFYKGGHINQHSVGFKTIKAETGDKGAPTEHRIIKEIFLYEASSVLWGANPLTDTISVGKSLTKEDIHKDYFETLKEVNNLAKLFKSGHLTDETFELLEVQLAQKTDKLKQLFDLNTLPAADAVEPKNGEELLDALKAFNNSLILQNGIERFAGAAG